MLLLCGHECVHEPAVTVHLIQAKRQPGDGVEYQTAQRAIPYSRITARRDEPERERPEE